MLATVVDTMIDKLPLMRSLNVSYNRMPTLPPRIPFGKWLQLQV